MRQVTRRRGQCFCRSGCAAGSHESIASKEIKDLDKLKDVKILLSGLPFGLSALARAPSRRKGSLPLQPPGYLLRCHPIDELVLIRWTEIKQQIQQELTGSGVTSDSELSLSCISSEAVGLLPFLRAAALLAAFFTFLAFFAASWSYLTFQNLSPACKI